MAEEGHCRAITSPYSEIAGWRASTDGGFNLSNPGQLVTVRTIVLSATHPYSNPLWVCSVKKCLSLSSAFCFSFGRSKCPAGRVGASWCISVVLPVPPSASSAENDAVECCLCSSQAFLCTGKGTEGLSQEVRTLNAQCPPLSTGSV